jgi:putative transcriptional regulator
MASCDLCGRETQLYEARVEGTVLTACKSCASFGQIISAPKKQFKKRSPARPRVEEPEEIIVSDIAARLRKLREKNGLTQKEFAAKITEKESLVQKVESGHLNPSLDVAKKIARIFRVRLTEFDEPKKVTSSGSSKSAEFTIADFIKKK